MASFLTDDNSQYSPGTAGPGAATACSAAGTGIGMGMVQVANTSLRIQKKASDLVNYLEQLKCDDNNNSNGSTHEEDFGSHAEKLRRQAKNNLSRLDVRPPALGRELMKEELTPLSPESGGGIDDLQAPPLLSTEDDEPSSYFSEIFSLYPSENEDGFRSQTDECGFGQFDLTANDMIEGHDHQLFIDNCNLEG
eukprot:CAMPEP_0197543968 /NCGR_PEP_ID=MMETSP1318-20131121/68522_1 /TAXON_ID=552666 /ORGANISM="Partenskyella glossopodia, Strain RCC365" /LENGTH=193 /DNA_ID=CAMNT_0043103337 /DNA_START=509 /DNA_END=1090 /DNA_ORIENTATION=-